MERRRPIGNADERTVLTGWLDWQRQTVHVKCAGLGDTKAHAAPLPMSPAMSIAGLVSHLTSVERDWFEGSFLGSVDVLSADGGGWDVSGQSITQLLRNYSRQCSRSQQILAEHSLDELEAYAPPGLELVSLRWIVTHLIEETGRHLGHLDLLREMADGSRGQ